MLLQVISPVYNLQYKQTLLKQDCFYCYVGPTPSRGTEWKRNCRDGEKQITQEEDFEG